MTFEIADLWPLAVVVGVLWTLVVLVYAATRSGMRAAELWAWGAFLIVVATVLSLAAAGVIRP